MGKLQVDDHGFRFLAEQGRGAAWLPFEGLDAHLAGHNREQIELRHPIAEGWVIHCYERAIFTTDGLHTVPTLAALLKQGGARRRALGWPLRLLIVLLVAVLVSIVLLWMQRPAMVRSVVNMMPLATEQEFGNALWETVKAKEIIIDMDPRYRPQVEAVTKRLLATVDKASGHTFAFHIAQQDGVVNAYALPGGHIIIYTGLLKAVKRPEQLAGVLAHEMAHVTERHALQNQVSSLGLAGLVVALFGSVEGLSEVIVSGTQQLAEKSFSREAESEADLVAWKTLLAAKLDPRGLIEFFSILDHREGDTATMMRPLAWLSTHPMPDERMEALRQLEAVLTGKEAFEPVIGLVKP